MFAERRSHPRRPARVLAGIAVAVSLAAAGCAGEIRGHGSVLAGQAADPTGSADPSASAAPSGGGEPSGGATPTPTSARPKRPGSCAGADAEVGGAPPSQAILKSVPDGLPLSPATSGPQSLSLLVNDVYQDQPDANQVLTSAGYVTGYQNTFARGTSGRPDRNVEFVEILQFADGAGACAFAAWEAKNFGLRTEPRIGIPGVLAAVTKGGTNRVSTVECLAVKGNLVVLSGGLRYGAVDLVPVAGPLLRTQYGAV